MLYIKIAKYIYKLLHIIKYKDRESDNLLIISLIKFFLLASYLKIWDKTIV